MNRHIYIVSVGNPNKQVTLSQLPTQLIELGLVSIAVPFNQYDAYKKMNKNVCIYRTPKEVKGNADNIKDHLLWCAPFKHIIIMEDNIAFYHRKIRGKQIHYQRSAVGTIHNIINSTISILQKENSVAAVVFPLVSTTNVNPVDYVNGCCASPMFAANTDCYKEWVQTHNDIKLWKTVNPTWTLLWSHRYGCKYILHKGKRSK